MPASPTAAQSAASRRNGARSGGPATPEGRARSSLNATRRNLAGAFRLLPDEDAAALDRLRAGLAARLAPADEVEDHWVDEQAFAMWRLRRLRGIEAAALARAGGGDGGGTDEPEAAPSPLPSLATLARYRGRIERDLRLAEAGLEAARARRPHVPARLERAAASRLRWLADRMDEEATAAAANDDDDRTNEPEPFAAAAPGVPAAAARTNEPEPPAAAPNRAERRRLAALARKAAARAAA